MSSQVLELSDITKRYDSGELAVDVLNGLNLSLKQKETAALVAPSGTGKTTLLQIAGLLDSPTSGVVKVVGNDVAGLSDVALTNLRNASIGFVYQFHHLLPEFSALENVMLPSLIAGLSNRDATEKALGLLSDVGLSERAEHRPAELSGGEKQRVAIARALVNHPALILADEPTGNLDAENAARIVDRLVEVCAKNESALLMATHNPDLAKKLGKTYSFEAGVLKDG